MIIDLSAVISEHSKWIKSHGCEGEMADLRGADLRGADLRGADLRGADLLGADLRWANLRGADLRWANLSGANLRGADMIGANLRESNLRLANLRLANLSGEELDDMYVDIPVTLAEVRQVILSNRDRLSMSDWHSDSAWHNGKAKPVDECGTAHCIAGWAHHLASLRRPEMISDRVNVYLVGRLALGDEAAEHFYDSDEDAMAWLESLDV